MEYQCINCGCRKKPIFIKDNSCSGEGENNILSKSPEGKYMCPECGQIVEYAIDFSKKKL